MAVFAQVFSTSFTGANENPLSEGGNFATNPSRSAIQRVSNNNTAGPTNFGTDCGSYYTGAVNSGQFSRGSITTVGTAGSGAGMGLSLWNSTSAETFYRFAIDHAASNNASLTRAVAGVYTTLVQWTQAFTNADQFAFGVVNSRLYVYDKTATLVQSYNDTGGGVTSSGKPGIAFSSSTSSGTFIDDWSCGNFDPGSTIAIANGSLILSGQSVILRPGSTTYLRYRK